MVMNVYNSEGKRSGSCRMNVMRSLFTWNKWNKWRWKQDILRFIKIDLLSRALEVRLCSSVPPKGSKSTQTQLSLPFVVMVMMMMMMMMMMMIAYDNDDTDRFKEFWGRWWQWWWMMMDATGGAMFPGCEDVLDADGDYEDDDKGKGHERTTKR